MLTTNTTVPAWLEELAPAGLRAEVDDLIGEIQNRSTQLAGYLGRARELLAHFELQAQDAARVAGDAGGAVSEMLAEITGSQALFTAVDFLSDQCDPTLHPLYAAIAQPSHLRCDTLVVMTNPAGENVQVFVSNHTHDLDKGFTFDVFEAGDPSGTKWSATHDELIAGVQRGLAIQAGDDK